jgi:antirestriction protein ArdC
MEQFESLVRAKNSQSTMNYGEIFRGFAAMGIDDVQPRENVFTFKAWQALGRVVRKGEHGIKVVTFVPIEAKGAAKELAKRMTIPRTTTVFHISQTEPIQ